MRPLALACLLGGALAGCKSTHPPTAANEQPKCTNFDWMLGSWETHGDTTQSIERWMPDDAGLLRGESITRAEGQVVYTESLRITRGPGGVEYRAAPQEQPPNVFPLESCGETWARFTDPAHDWPQSIHYARMSDTLTATVSGTTDGKERTETWSWTLAAPESVVSTP